MDSGMFLKAMVNAELEQVVWVKELPKHVQVCRLYSFHITGTHIRVCRVQQTLMR
jgi:hypothetical protein